MKKDANYKCLKCNYEWISYPGPTQCPICNNLYVRWVDYEQWREKHGWYWENK